MKKFIISSDALRPALKKLSLAINTKSVLPVLSNIYVKVTKDAVELITTDLELTVSYKIVAEAKMEFEMLLPFDFFNRLINLFNSAPVIIELISAKKAVITGDNEDYNIDIKDDIKAFPELPTLPKKNVIALNEDFVGMLSYAMMSVSGEEKTPALTYACLDMKAKDTHLVSTDTHIMYKHKIGVKNTEADQLLISSKFASALDGLKDMELGWTKEKIAVKSDKITVWSTRFDGKYVNYNTVIPSFPVTLKLNNKLLNDALNKACLSSDPMKHTNIYLKREPGKIHIEFDDPGLGRKGHLVVACQYSGETEMIGINAKKLITVLTQVDADEICLHIGGPSKAVLVSSEENADYLGLIMPLMPNKN